MITSIPSSSSQAPSLKTPSKKRALKSVESTAFGKKVKASAKKEKGISERKTMAEERAKRDEEDSKIRERDVSESVDRKLADLERKMEAIRAERELVQLTAPFDAGVKKADKRILREAAPKKIANQKERGDGDKDWKEDETESDTEEEEEEVVEEDEEAEDVASASGKLASENEVEMEVEKEGCNDLGELIPGVYDPEDVVDYKLDDDELAELGEKSSPDIQRFGRVMKVYGHALGDDNALKVNRAKKNIGNGLTVECLEFTKAKPYGFQPNGDPKFFTHVINLSMGPAMVEGWMRMLKHLPLDVKKRMHKVLNKSTIKNAVQELEVEVASCGE